jgi:hypothetical protein
VVVDARCSLFPAKEGNWYKEPLACCCTRDSVPSWSLREYSLAACRGCHVEPAILHRDQYLWCDFQAM